MFKRLFFYCIHIAAASILLGACAPASPQADSGSNPPQKPGLRILAAESFMADIAQNVAGDRAKVESLMPLGIDPHAFEPTPADVAKVADADVMIVIGAGMEEWLQETLENAGGEHVVIAASDGLVSRTPPAEHDHEGNHYEEEHQEEHAAGTEGIHAEEAHSDEDHQEEGHLGEDHADGEEGHHHDSDPHFWLDPINVIHFVENIRAGLSTADPEGADVYAENARAYSARLTELDAWIKQEVEKIPAAERLLVTNHESFGYFADRYGFDVIGTVIPSVSTSASPSAQQLAGLVDAIRASGARAVFLETGANPALAEQAAKEAGVKLMTQLFTHSLTDAAGVAPTYIKMMEYNTHQITEGLVK